LRCKQINGRRFRRQQPIGPYIVDFFCPSAKLIVELDGDQHGADSHAFRDSLRTCWLEERGYRVLRVSNAEFWMKKAAVLERITVAVQSNAPPPRIACGDPTLPPGEGG
jgi:very-short-patch-repair endonuclease